MNHRECQIFYLFRSVLSSLLPLRSVGRSNFDKGLHNLIMLIQKRHKIKLLYQQMESSMGSYEKETLHIYILNPREGEFSNSTDRLIEEQTVICKLKTDTHGLNKDLDFLTPYTYFHK